MGFLGDELKKGENKPVIQKRELEEEINTVGN